MKIKFELQHIDNAQGEGVRRQFVRLHAGPAKSPDELSAAVERSCSLTKGDVAAALSELCQLAVKELAAGNRFYLPGMGYLTLSAGLKRQTSVVPDKLTGRDIYLRGVNFLPEKRLLAMLRRRVGFERDDLVNRSYHYTDAQLWPKVEAETADGRPVTVQGMCRQYGLSRYMARLWLSRFVADGRLLEEHFGRQHFYFRLTADRQGKS